MDLIKVTGGAFLDVSRKEAKSLICSLRAQLESHDSNIGRKEYHCDRPFDGTFSPYFSIGVRKDKHDVFACLTNPR